MNKLVAGFAFVATLVAGAAVPNGASQAVPVINNGSFEVGTNPGSSFLGPLGVGETHITDWAITSGSVDYIGGYWTAQQGTRSIDLNGTSAGSISQTISGLSIGQHYTVSFWLGGNSAAGPTVKTLDVIAAFINSTVMSPFAYDTTGSPSLPAMNWLPAYFSFTADATSADLTFASTVISGGTAQFPTAFGPALDNISIAATPLPAALPLFGSVLGAFGLFSWFRRRLTATA